MFCSTVVNEPVDQPACQIPKSTRTFNSKCIVLTHTHTEAFALLGRLEWLKLDREKELMTVEVNL